MPNQIASRSPKKLMWVKQSHKPPIWEWFILSTTYKNCVSDFMFIIVITIDTTTIIVIITIIINHHYQLSSSIIINYHCFNHMSPKNRGYLLHGSCHTSQSPDVHTHLAHTHSSSPQTIDFLQGRVDQPLNWKKS